MPRLPRGWCFGHRLLAVALLSLQQSIDLTLNLHPIFVVWFKHLMQKYFQLHTVSTQNCPSPTQSIRLTNLLAWKGPMLLKIMSRERGRSPPSPGEPVMVKVLPLPVTPYVNNRPVNIDHHNHISTFLQMNFTCSKCVLLLNSCKTNLVIIDGFSTLYFHFGSIRFIDLPFLHWIRSSTSGFATSSNSSLWLVLIPNTFLKVYWV